MASKRLPAACAPAYGVVDGRPLPGQTPSDDGSLVGGFGFEPLAPGHSASMAFLLSFDAAGTSALHAFGPLTRMEENTVAAAETICFGHGSVGVSHPADAIHDK